jgi:hypothetical protein
LLAAFDSGQDPFESAGRGRTPYDAWTHVPTSKAEPDVPPRQFKVVIEDRLKPGLRARSSKRELVRIFDNGGLGELAGFKDRIL